jgi:hypothetical protein
VCAASEPDHEAEVGGEADVSHAYLATIRWLEGNVYLDAFWDVTEILGVRGLARIAKARLTDRDLPEDIDSFPRSLHALRLRVRFNSPDMRGPILVKSDDVIERDDFEAYIRSFSPTDLKTFIKGAAI